MDSIGNPSIIFDNCSGQNNNRMVVRFAQYLVDCNIFREVEMIFFDFWPHKKGLRQEVQRF
jgi:hypothetical protein